MILDDLKLMIFDDLKLMSLMISNNLKLQQGMPVGRLVTSSDIATPPRQLRNPSAVEGRRKGTCRIEGSIQRQGFVP